MSQVPNFRSIFAEPHEPLPEADPAPIAIVPNPPPIVSAAKRDDPRYLRTTLLVTKELHKAAKRRWEDTHPEEDFSDLVELLLRGYMEDEGDA